MATEEKTINVVGMHCPSCVAAVVCGKIANRISKVVEFIPIF